MSLLKPSYKDKDPKGWCGDPSRGAALGRHSYHAEDKTLPIKLFLCEARLDSGGYDTNGTYFGHHQRLYWYCTSDGTVDAMLRARDRKAAQAKILETYTQAKFYR